MIEKYKKIEEAISRLLLAACTVLVVVAAVGRTFGHPIIWSVDMAQLLFVWVCFFGANQAMRTDQHVGVDLLISYLSPRVQRWLMAFHFLLIEAFLATMVVYGTNLTLLNVERQFGDTQVSYAWVTVSVPVGCALLFVTILGRLVTMMMEARAAKTAEESRS